jgi:ribosomal-protein-alanine N-acetyltransferase
MKNDIFIKSENVYMRALLESDVEGNYANWLNNPEINLYNSHGRFPQTKQKLIDYVKQVNSNNNTLVLAVIDNKTQTHVGNISLQNINWIDRNAEIAFLLGEKDFWGKGVMLEAGSLLIKHGFENLNLHRIHCGTSILNVGMQKLAMKLGMNQEGIRKEAMYKNNQYIDIIEYGIINSNEVL